MTARKNRGKPAGISVPLKTVGDVFGEGGPVGPPAAPTGRRTRGQVDPEKAPPPPAEPFTALIPFTFQATEEDGFSHKTATQEDIVKQAIIYMGTGMWLHGVRYSIKVDKSGIVYGKPE